MKVAITSDRQMRGKDLKERLAATEIMLADMVSRQVEWVLDCGDFFEYGRIQDGNTSAQEITGGVSTLVIKYGIPHLLLSGNHDYSLPTNPSAITIFDGHPWIIPTPEHPHYYTLYGKLCVVTAPWPRSGKAEYMEQLLDAIDAVSTIDAPALLIGHFGVEGAILNSGGQYKGKKNEVTLTTDELISLPVDVVFLGHVHQQQLLFKNDAGYAYYCGTFLKSNHAEENNEDGWWLFDTEQVMKPRFIPYTMGPKYWTFRNHEELQSVREQISEKDCVRLIDWQGPPPLRDNQVAQLAHSKTPVPLTLSNVVELPNVDPMKLRELLPAWAGLNDIDYPDDEKFWGKVDALQVKFPPPLWGSLTKIGFIGLDAIGPYSDFIWTPKSGLHVILGENWVGKSLLIESLYASLYGAWLTPGRNIKDQCGDTAKFVIGISTADKHLVVNYEPLQTLMKVNNFQSGKPEAEGVTQCRAWLTGQVGDSETVRRACYFDQRGHSSFVEATDEARMTALAELLGLSVYQDWAKHSNGQCVGYDRLEGELLGLEDTSQQASLEILQLEEQLQAMAPALEKLTKQLEVSQADFQYSRKIRESITQVYREQSKSNQRMAGLKVDENQWITLLKKADTLFDRRCAQQPNHALHLEAVESVRSWEKLVHSYDLLQAKIEQLTQLKRPLADAGCKPQGYIPCPLLDVARRSQDELAEALELRQKAGEPHTSLRQAKENLLILEKSIDPEARQLTVQAYVDQMNDLVSEGQRYANLLTKSHEDMEEVQQRLNKLAEELKELEDSQESLTLLFEQETEIQTVLAPLQADYHRAAGKLELLLRQRKEADARHKELDDKLLVMDDWKTIAQAVGRNGIPQLLISQALPDIQDLLDEMITAAFDNQFRLIIDNQSMTRGGKVKDAISLLFEEASGKLYDARACSGGALALTKILWMFAILRWIRKTRPGYQVLFLDEPTAAMDLKNTEGFVRLLEIMQEEFEQIFLVTHDCVLASRFPQHVRLINGRFEEPKGVPF